jgi:hypothetical protein
MVKIIHIYPKLYSYINKIQDMDFLLYHEAKQSEDYVKFMAKNNNYKILDNSFYELRKEVDYYDVIRLGKQMNINEIVLPDKLHDGVWTGNKTHENIKAYGKVYKEQKWKVAAVLQGRDLLELESTLIKFLHLNVDVIMIPRKIYFHDTYYFGRIFVWLKLIYYFETFVKNGGEIHWLGANCWGDFYPPYSKLIRSVDSKLFVKTLTNGWKWKNWKDVNGSVISKTIIKQSEFIQQNIINNYYGEI